MSVLPLISRPGQTYRLPTRFRIGRFRPNLPTWPFAQVRRSTCHYSLIFCQFRPNLVKGGASLRASLTDWAQILRNANEAARRRPHRRVLYLSSSRAFVPLTCLGRHCARTVRMLSQTLHDQSARMFVQALCYRLARMFAQVLCARTAQSHAIHIERVAVGDDVRSITIERGHVSIGRQRPRARGVERHIDGTNLG